MCSRGETGFKRWVLGSVAQKILRHSRAPVLVLHESAGMLNNQDPDGHRPVRILVALDGSSLAEIALEPAAVLAAALSAPEKGTLHLLYVVPPLESTTAEETTGRAPQLDISEARMYLQMTAQALREKMQGRWDLIVHTSVVEHTDVADTIICTAEKAGASDVIALASHGRSGLARWVMGSIAERLLDGTRLPLLVVHPPWPANRKEDVLGQVISG